MLKSELTTMLGNYRFLLFGILFLYSCTPSEKERAEHGPGATDSSEDYVIAKPPEHDNEANVHVIEIMHMKFEPAELTVRKGDKVIWINRDVVDHDVTEQSGNAWTSTTMISGASWTLTASQSADYYCNLHQVMKGKLIVVE